MSDPATTRGRGRPSTQEEIEHWLLGLLAAGRIQANTIYQSGKLRGYSARTLNTVKKKLGVARVQKNRCWYWRDPEVPEAEDPKNFEQKVLQKMDEMARAVLVPRVMTEDGVAPADEYAVDKLGYCKQAPAGGLTGKIGPFDIINRIKQLTNTDRGHDDIARKVHSWAYPAAGLSESVVMGFLAANDVVVKPKSQLFPPPVLDDGIHF